MCRANRCNVGDELSVGELTIRALGGPTCRQSIRKIPVIDNISYLVGDGRASRPVHAPRRCPVRPGRADRRVGYSGGGTVDEDLRGRRLPAGPWRRHGRCRSTRASSPRRPRHLLRPLSEMTSTDFQVLPEEARSPSRRCRLPHRGPRHDRRRCSRPKTFPSRAR